jgi:hypothetical protein
VEEEEVETEEEEEDPNTVIETFFPHTQTGWECGKKCYNIFVPTFIPTCWVKDIDLTTEVSHVPGSLLQEPHVAYLFTVGPLL